MPKLKADWQSPIWFGLHLIKYLKTKRMKTIPTVGCRMRSYST